ncbi:hypothetical protein HMPREF0653_00823 [Prevotella disiens JCM 6334 = ATCC 29426]|uniref:Uncharacterized protein n=1 Tax=Prevotella disiens JCM 6334 = ATCC 29426 TaxID=1235811 RepID=A0ABP2Y8C4_9BACT|nr:hypothetical protein HMPREF0653_00823 [Prevotella disiens JCM 6334 = ATCC 29426]
MKIILYCIVNQSFTFLLQKEVKKKSKKYAVIKKNTYLCNVLRNK